MKWNSIETFFLDLDGTLLDLAFDNFFWHEHLPYVYANSKDIEFEKAKEDFEKMYKNKENSIQWYSLSYWSEILEIDLCSELLRVKNKIRTLNNSEKFLQILKERKVRIYLLTNCPRYMLHVKLNQVRFWKFFDEIISSEDFGYPKETDEFWNLLQKKFKYKKTSTVFIDDSKNVLDFSVKSGLNNVFLISKPDSNKEKQGTYGYKSIDSLADFSKLII